ncbi:probable iron binding protein from the HesB_IscA_SufA family [Lentimonas sp. CC19]|nr:probable iron binding protein from the HesB_IscA_SufA family [Lentimonas sp. CC10]CAA6695338.1 probable iron binding protein from the HesB_IscA_SufA family [Lentimonas sp. CC19]CAA7068824.1 probable iron binding protein from the HesB_IscA_SufA family [Lentimonas sp. CC11]
MKNAVYRFSSIDPVDRGSEAHLLSAMITLTDSAVAQIRILQAEKATEGQKLRILVEAGGCSGFEYGMSFDDKKDDDKLFESNGVDFLVDETSLEYLDGSVVDFDDGLSGKGFEVRNPNASSTCGCGRSFN